jgi:hypothetical protein
LIEYRGYRTIIFLLEQVDISGGDVCGSSEHVDRHDRLFKKKVKARIINIRWKKLPSIKITRYEIYHRRIGKFWGITGRKLTAEGHEVISI